MLKKRVMLASGRGTFNFLIEFNAPFPAKGALFVIRPNADEFNPETGKFCTLPWSKAARGYFLYSSEVETPSTFVSRSFEVDFDTKEVEIELMPWDEHTLSGRVSNILLVSEPSGKDRKYTTYFGIDNG